MRGRPRMYTCTECGRGIAACPDDPVHVTSGGSFCSRCLHVRASAPPPTVKPLPNVKPKSEARAAARRAFWANMSPEEKRARIAKMHAGRDKAKEATP